MPQKQYFLPSGKSVWADDDLSDEELDELFSKEDEPEPARPVKSEVGLPQKQEKSGIGKAWEWANTPLTDAPSDVANAVSGGLRSMRYRTPEAAQSNRLNAMISGFIEGGIEGLGNLGTEATSPLSIATSGTVWKGLKTLRNAAGMSKITSPTAKAATTVAEAAGVTPPAAPTTAAPASILGATAQDVKTARLPGHLAGAKPRYYSGQTGYNPQFENDVDKALYIVAQSTPSKRNAEYLDFLRKATGLPDEEIMKIARENKAKIREFLRGKEGGDVAVPRLYGQTPIKPKIKANGDGTFSPSDNPNVKYDAKGNKITDGPAPVMPPLAGGVAPKPVPVTTKPTPTPKTPEKAAALTPTSEPEVPAPLIIKEGDKPSRAREIWDLAKGSLTVDIPFITSAAMRQARPLAGTKNWFKAWVPQAKAFTSELAAKAHMDEIMSRELFRPTEVTNPITGKVKTLPSYAQAAGLRVGEMGKYTQREESLRTGLAERIPGFGKWVKASNRSYTAFLNDVRANTFQSMIDDARKLAEASGDIMQNPDNNMILRKTIADFVNNSTGAGSLGSFEKAADELSTILFSPRNIASQVRMLNPANYMNSNPVVRKAYLQSTFRTATLYAATAGAAKLGGAEVSLNPTSSDFGKIKIGDTRFDFGGGYQQYLVQMARQLLGGSTSSTKPNAQFQEFGSGYGKETRWESAVRFATNKLHPSLGAIVTGILDVTKDEPVDISDKVLQTYVPMIAQDIMELAMENPELLPTVSLMSMGIGGQTYGRDDYNEPKITPFIEQVTGMQVPTTKFKGGSPIDPRTIRRYLPR